MTPPTHSNPATNPAAQAFAAPELRAFERIAAGLAPALNELLSVVTGRANLLLDDPALDEQAHDALSAIYTAGESAISLVRQLRYLSGQAPAYFRIIDLNTLVEQSSEVLRRLLGGAITLELRLAPGLRLVTADADMLEQVLLALGLNARDAMPHGGRFVVRTASAARPDRAADEAPGGPAGDFVTLAVSDTGAGIAPEILPHLFEPFVTTKPPGRGAGLGLAAAQGIAHQHHGWIAAHTAAGGGAEFELFLPAAAREAIADQPVLRADRPGRGHETILLVEDDMPTREFTAAVLQDQGYRVLQAATAADALETWKWHGARINLLLTDVVLDGRQNGLELASRLRAAAPGLGLIVMSGHDRTILQRAGPPLSRCLFVQKPCRPQTLARALRALLDAPAP